MSEGSVEGKLSRRAVLGAGAAGGLGLAVLGGAGPALARGQRNAVAARKAAATGLLMYVPAQGGNFLLGIEVGFHEALTPLGWRFQTLIPPTNATAADEIKLIQQAIIRKPDALAVAYPGSGAGVAQIHQAHQQLKFVIVTNQGDEPFRRNEGLTLVGQDVFAAGGVAGTRLCELILASGKKSGTIIGGNEAPGGASILARYKGAQQAIAAFNKANNTSFSIINMPDFAVDQAKGVATYKAKYLQLGKNLAGILTLGFDSTNLMPTFGRTVGLKPGQVVIGGFDTGPSVGQAIKDGWVAFTMDQQFYSQGSISGWLAWQAVERAQVPPLDVNTGAAIVDKKRVEAVLARDVKMEELAKKYGFKK
jgi:simple sugar transport system substrate-binding protein